MNEHENARSILGVANEAGDAEIRAAYLQNIKDHPPDRSPAAFERIRDAYDLLRDPRRRAQSIFAVDPSRSLVSWLDEQPLKRSFVGPEPWLHAARKR
ncbi:MAG: molecular chaperone DnaJ [Acidobacteria bacterium]|nr:MAG: molecular chaperone DnaJ [Acidobacteriota bacterium]